MLVYSKQSSPAFRISNHMQYHRANQRILAGEDLSDLELEILVREPNSRTFSNRKQNPENMKKYLPRLESNERIRSHDIKRSFNVNLRRIPSSTSTVRLPGISPTRKSSISDSTNTTSTSSIPSIEITEPEAGEELELIIPFQGDNLLNNGNNPSQVFKTFEAERGTISGPRPPRSPRPIDPKFVTNKRSSGNSRRHFKRSQHFELTLQNIEEVKDMENDSSSLGRRDTSSLLGERVGADQREVRLVTGHHRSHSTPVDYRELRNKIEATRLVNMGDLSVEFTKHYLSKKGLKDEESDEEEIRNRCINWLKSLNSS